MARRKLSKKEKTLKALQGSIKKWEDILTGKIPDKGNKNCPLCKMFLNHKSLDSDNDCLGCPVRKATGEAHCTDSPYTTKWAMAHDTEGLEDFAMNDEQVLAAREELDFLRSLL